MNPKKMISVVIGIGVVGVAYLLYQKFFGKSDAEKAAETLAEKQLQNSQTVQGEITSEVYKATVNVTITREQAKAIADSVYYYLNSIFFTESDRQAIIALLFGLNANSLRLVSEQFGRKSMARFSVWFDSDLYDLKGAMIKAFGATTFNQYFALSFNNAKL